MNTRHSISALTLLALLSTQGCKSAETEVVKKEIAKPAPKKLEALVYPNTKMDETEDNYHGTIVKDPYRWLEDQNAPEVAEWVKEQNKVSFGFLEKIESREPFQSHFR